MSRVTQDTEYKPETSESPEREPKWCGKTAEGEYEWDLAGVRYQSMDDDGGPQWVCSPLIVESYTRDSEGRSWGTRVSLVDPDGKEHTVSIPCELLSGNGTEVCALLLRHGLRMGHGRTAKARLFEYLQKVDPQQREISVKQVGWSGDVFVLPDQVIGCDSDEPMAYQPDSPTDQHFAVAGSLEEWKENVGALAEGNSRLMFGISCAVGAPMLSLLDMEGGGFNLRGGSSTGKSTAVIVAGSVCGGGGRHGFGTTWRSTGNALEATAFAHNDNLLVLDELGQVSPREAGDCAYLLANGSAKARMKRTLDVPAPQKWRLLVLSAGEISLGEQVEAAGGRRRGGHEVRLVDVPADAGKGQGLFEDLHGRPDAGTFSDDLRRAAKSYYGSPLRAFVERLVRKRQFAQDFIRTQIGEFLDSMLPPEASGEVRRVATLFAVVGAAGTSPARGESFRGRFGVRVTPLRLVFEPGWISVAAAAGRT